MDYLGQNIIAILIILYQNLKAVIMNRKIIFNHTKSLMLCIVFMFLTAQIGFAQSKLGRAEDSLNEKRDRGGTSSERNSSSFDDDDNPFVAAIAYYVAEAVLAVSYYTLIESPSEFESNSSLAGLTKYPYYSVNKGNYTYDLETEETSFFRAGISSRYISENNNLKGMHLNLDMRFLKRLGVEVDYMQLWEDNPNFGKDNLAIFSLLAQYHRVRTQKFDVKWGVGTSYVAGNVNQFGFAYGLGSELFFSKPLSLEINFNQTFINTETINKFNGLLNYHVDRYKFTGGYEHLRIGNQNFSMVSVGVGVFF